MFSVGQILSSLFVIVLEFKDRYWRNVFTKNLQFCVTKRSLSLVTPRTLLEMKDTTDSESQCKTIWRSHMAVFSNDDSNKTKTVLFESVISVVGQCEQFTPKYRFSSLHLGNGGFQWKIILGEENMNL